MGNDFVTSAYGEEPRDSAKRIYEYIREQYPVATNQQIRKVLGITLDKI